MWHYANESKNSLKLNKTTGTCAVRVCLFHLESDRINWFYLTSLSHTKSSPEKKEKEKQRARKAL